LNTAAVGSPVVEQPAKRGDLHGEIAAFDDGSRPHRIHDLVLGDEIPRPLYENTENFEGARPDRDRNQCAGFMLPEEAAPVEAKALEQEDVGTGERVHASASPAKHEQGCEHPAVSD
jgi:hypothetical protein